MNIVILSPGYPADMPEFTRGLAQAGAHVLGVGDQPVSALSGLVKSALADYLHVRSLWDEEAVIDAMRNWLRGRAIDRVAVVGIRVGDPRGIAGLRRGGRIGRAAWRRGR